MINYLSKPFIWFFKLEAASGLVLLFAAIIAFILLMDTFKDQISVIFPGILKMSDSLYLVINDLKLFIKDLVR